MTNAAISATADPSLDAGEPAGEAHSLTSDAWRLLRRRPIFWVSAGLILLFLLMAIAPGLFTNTSPTAAVLKESRATPSTENWFGRDVQGYDIYARTIYGARASIMVGVLATLFTTLLGALLGIVAGFAGGWVDTLISRITDVFFAIPLLLGGILFMSTFQSDVNTSYFVIVMKVVLVLALLGWPSITRLMRSSVLQVKPNDYVQAARALGASPWRIIRQHILPNAMAPVIVVSTINLGVYIAVEATLSYLGIGLTPPAISWGVAISAAQSGLRSAPHMLLFPAMFLSLAVLAFIMLGDAVRDAFDPKTR
ncbi:MAG: ABC transporter permease [Micrococcales bacterium]|nr:ABC transporter permease [Micrococcales bacterium]